MISKEEKTKLTKKGMLEIIQRQIRETEDKLRSNKRTINRLALENTILKSQRNQFYLLKNRIESEINN
jgi:hypothetical protein